MHVPEYVTKDEVRRVCRELSISDWSTKDDDSVDRFEAEIVLRAVNAAGLPIALDAFVKGLRVELEHGTRFPDANVTNNHPLLTGRIVLAHLYESMDYYERIAVMELEGDLAKALAAGDPERSRLIYRRLIEARLHRDRAVLAALATPRPAADDGPPRTFGPAPGPGSALD